MDLQFYVTAAVTMFVIVDPIALVPLFIALTQGMDDAQRKAVGRRACLIAIVLMALFGLLGDAILRFSGISMPAFRIAGGILLFLTALDMLFERRTQRRENQHPSSSDPSVFPLATPLIAGPGAFTTMILLVNTPEAQGDWGHVAAIHAIMVGVVLVSLGFFRLATPIEHALGRTGIVVITRLLGMLLAALSVQFVLDGVKGTGLIAG
jgi:multiple antibiotic resistance protein